MRKYTAGNTNIEQIFHPAADPRKRSGGLRVAVYCRVSTEKDGQQTSLDTQEKAFIEKIENNPKWRLAGIYTDEGITGTSVRRRTGFQRMLRDCEAGKIDYILTKSISRFARNTVECLSCIRNLQSMGVELIFEKEGIDTGQPYSEILLTILAAFAQEESRSISENIKWGIRKRFEAGIDRWTNIYGYTRNGEFTYQIVRHEAAVVVRIFELYEHGYSIAQIADILTEKQVKSPSGAEKWDQSVIAHMLSNEKYIGDIRLQNAYTVDHISHREVKNDCTVVPAYYLHNHHAQIVDRKTYDRVQKIKEMTTQKKNTPVQYPFDDKLRCPYCGNRLYQRKVPVQNQLSGWCCERGEASCRKFIIRSAHVEKAMLWAYEALDNELIERQLDAKSDAAAEAAETMLAMRQTNPRFGRVDYYWIDELVDHIEFGTHRGRRGHWRARSDIKAHPEEWEDYTMTVFWKCGLKSTVFSGVNSYTETPENIVGLYGAYLKRLKERKENQYDCAGN